MASETDYAEVYGQAEKAYLQGQFQEAAGIIDRMAEDYPNDPTILLLRGHIYYYGLHKYEFARQQYDLVLQLTEQPELIDLANDALEKINQIVESEFSKEETNSTQQTNLNHREKQNSSDSATNDYESDWENNFQFDSKDWDSADADGELEDPTFEQDGNFANPFEIGDEGSKGNIGEYNKRKSEEQSSVDTYAKEQQLGTEDTNPFTYNSAEEEEEKDWLDSDGAYFNIFEVSSDEHQESEDTTFVVSSELVSSELEEIILSKEDDYKTESHREDDYSNDLAIDNYTIDTYTESKEESEDISDVSRGDISEVEDFSNLDVIDQDLPASELFPPSLPINTDVEESTASLIERDISRTPRWGESNNQEDTINLKEPESISKQPVQVKQGWVGAFENASLNQKTWIVAISAGLVSALCVGIISVGTALKNSDKDNQNGLTTGIIGLSTGFCTFATTWFLGRLITSQIKNYTTDLQTQFEAVRQGHLNVVANVYSKEELGNLATGFNEMIRVVSKTTTEAQKRAEETERAREDLQRQVIRLLDDVEGAARGDLTVKAKVTADVLGAVADAFNLTIENLRKIILQVKEAAKEVNQGATDSELFARSQSSDALRMAEELAVTLNSVQMMTDSIQRVAESAREAEQVARSSSVTALKGGEAVEHTVSGILQIRETVSETARKVKRLAEASQEISKIVALIANISSRTNLLALNASIQAAKAGEAGRGFAIVADEVRQLADRAAKALQEIEQIVLQIQSETGSVMMAMEEGLQQVIDVTNRAEQAKGSLNDIIQVANRIDALVRSITADTVDQRENSRAVAQVMQSVELTAQETSQESQRVAGALQNLVLIARELLLSVEKFRVEDGTHD